MEWLFIAVVLDCGIAGYLKLSWTWSLLSKGDVTVDVDVARTSIHKYTMTHENQTCKSTSRVESLALARFVVPHMPYIIYYIPYTIY